MKRILIFIYILAGAVSANGQFASPQKWQHVSTPGQLVRTDPRQRYFLFLSGDTFTLWDSKELPQQKAALFQVPHCDFFTILSSGFSYDGTKLAISVKTTYKHFDGTEHEGYYLKVYDIADTISLLINIETYYTDQVPAVTAYFVAFTANDSSCVFDGWQNKKQLYYRSDLYGGKGETYGSYPDSLMSYTSPPDYRYLIRVTETKDSTNLLFYQPSQGNTFVSTISFPSATGLFYSPDSRFVYVTDSREVYCVSLSTDTPIIMSVVPGDSVFYRKGFLPLSNDKFVVLQDSEVQIHRASDGGKILSLPSTLSYQKSQFIPAAGGTGFLMVNTIFPYSYDLFLADTFLFADHYFYDYKFYDGECFRPSIIFDTSGTRIFRWGSFDSAIYMCNAATGAELRKYGFGSVKGSQAEIRDAFISSDNKLMVTLQYSGIGDSIAVCDFERDSLYGFCSYSTYNLNYGDRITVSNDEKFIAFTKNGDKDNLQVWNSLTHSLLWTRSVDNNLDDSRFSPSGKYLLPRNTFSTRFIFSAETGDLIDTIYDSPYNLSFSPKGRYCVFLCNKSGSDYLKIYDLDSLKIVNEGFARYFFFTYDDRKCFISDNDSLYINIFAQTDSILFDVNHKMTGSVYSPDGKQALLLGNHRYMLCDNKDSTSWESVDDNSSITKLENTTIPTFPNPAKDEINFALPQDAFIDNIKIYSTRGVECAHYEIKRFLPENQSFNLSFPSKALLPGSYFVIIKSTTNRYLGHFILN
jgi:hypothetical protein